jgi:hypothetical protein
MKSVSVPRTTLSGILVALGAVSTACGTASPVSTPAASAAHTKPGAGAAGRPTAEQTRAVQAFLGQWVYDSTITLPGSAPVKAELTLSCKEAAAGRAALCAFGGEIPGIGPMDASILVGADRLDNKVHFMAITSDDELHDHVCSWRDEKNLECVPLKAGLGGQPVTEELSFAFDGARGSFKSVIHQADGSAVVFDAPGQRVSTLPARPQSTGKPPEPSAEQKRIVAAFMGGWTLDADIKLPSDERTGAKLDLSCRPTAAGKAALCSLRADDVAGRPYSAVILVGHDPFDKTPHFMLMSSDDEVWHRPCTWKSETALSCGPMRTGVLGMPATTELTFDFGGAKGSTRWLTDLGDGKTCLLTAQMTR